MCCIIHYRGTVSQCISCSLNATARLCSENSRSLIVTFSASRLPQTSSSNASAEKLLIDKPDKNVTVQSSVELRRGRSPLNAFTANHQQKGKYAENVSILLRNGKQKSKNISQIDQPAQESLQVMTLKGAMLLCRAEDTTPDTAVLFARDVTSRRVTANCLMPDCKKLTTVAVTPTLMMVLAAGILFQVFLIAAMSQQTSKQSKLC